MENLQLQYFSVFHIKRVRREFKKNIKKSIYFIERSASIKKHLGNFPVFCPIENFSVFLQKRVRRVFLYI